MNQENQPLVILNQQTKPYTNVPINEQPARIKTALEYLGMLTFKTMPRAAVNDQIDGIQWAEVPKLTGNELAAQSSACEMLRRYFSGELSLDAREIGDSKIKNKLMNEGNSAGVHIGCFACIRTIGDIPNPKCKFCKGSGEVLVFSTVGG